jgi:hypothetical protein
METESQVRKVHKDIKVNHYKTKPSIKNTIFNKKRAKS